MERVSVVIPNYNGKRFLKACLGSLERQSFSEFETILVDDGSTDGSIPYVREKFPWVRLVALEQNGGFCRAVNAGIRAAKAPYVLLLNNDVAADKEFVGEMLSGIRRYKKCFSCSAQLRNMHHPELVDDAGDYYCALGWAYALGKDKPLAAYQKPRRIFASCGGAAIYRKAVFEQIGYFDEAHFAYMEDIDIGYRARIHGWYNVYEPGATVLHAGSAVSGSRHNAFKVKLSSANNAYIIGKNMPLFQIFLNFPFLFLGFCIKTVYFAKKKMGMLYLKGYAEGIARCFGNAGKEHKVRFKWHNLWNYCCIQGTLWLDMVRIFIKS